MIGYELKLLFNQDKAYLTTKKAMSLEQLYLPEIAKVFKTCYWVIKVISYDINQKEIFCEVISYNNGKTDFEESQQELTDKLIELKAVRFRDINTLALLRGLHKPNKENIPAIKYKSVHKNSSFSESSSTREQYKQIINTSFFIPIKEVRFISSGILIERKFEQHYKSLELTIHNEYIKEEFDAVKNYFANVLKTKKIKVFVNIEIIDNNVISVEVKSPEIDKIDRSFIDDVKIDFLKSGLRSSLKLDNEKNIFTVDEYFETITTGNSNSSLFYENEQDFLEDLMLVSNSKHYSHLRFLSSKHDHDILKLRFVHKPLSFIFLISGDHKYHFIWETLNTEEATYIWSIEKNITEIKLTLPYIDNSIKIIKEQGKTSYIKFANDKLKRVYHDYSDSKIGFKKWKDDLSLVLV